MSPLFHTRNFKIVSITSLGSKVRFLFIPARSLVQRVKCFVSPRNYQIPCFQARCVLDSNLTAFFLGIFEPTFTTTRTNCLHKRNAKSVSSTIPKLLKLFWRNRSLSRDFQFFSKLFFTSCVTLLSLWYSISFLPPSLRREVKGLSELLLCLLMLLQYFLWHSHILDVF